MENYKEISLHALFANITSGVISLVNSAAIVTAGFICAPDTISKHWTSIATVKPKRRPGTNDEYLAPKSKPPAHPINKRIPVARVSAINIIASSLTIRNTKFILHWI